MFILFSIAGIEIGQIFSALAADFIPVPITEGIKIIEILLSFFEPSFPTA